MSRPIISIGKREGNNPALQGVDVIPEHEYKSEMDDVSKDRLKQLWFDLVHAKYFGDLEALILCYIRDYYQGDEECSLRVLVRELREYYRSEEELSHALVRLVMFSKIKVAEMGCFADMSIELELEQ